MDGAGGSLRSRRFRQLWAVLAFFGVLLTGSLGAYAQESVEWNAQRFRPAAGPYSIFTVETAGTLGHLEPTGSVILDYASEPLLLEPVGGGDDEVVIDQQLAMHLVAGVGLFERGQLDLELPVYFVNEVELGDDVEGGTIGDLSIRPKFNLLRPGRSGVGLSVAADVSVPTGREASLIGDSAVGVAPMAIVDYRYRNVVVAANVGARFREEAPLRDLGLGDGLEYGAGAEVDFLHGLLRLGGEVYGRTELDDPFADAQLSPLEGLFGAKVVTDTGFSVMAGAGGDLVTGVGAPDFRAFVGLRYAFQDTDADSDGVRDIEDQCPEEPEDIDGFEDADGCPDPDNDDDGVPDVADECPQAAGPAENNGCPVVDEVAGDEDGDGVPDEIDECPDEAGSREAAGCPEGDASDDDISGDDGSDDQGDDAGVDDVPEQPTPPEPPAPTEQPAPSEPPE